MKPCKPFAGYIAKNGYGHKHNPRTNKNDCAHRVIYEQEVGPIPPGYTIDHLCEFKACVEPTHLEAVPHYVNCHRGRGTKLTDQQVVEIRTRAESSLELAARYGVHNSTIRRIRSYHRHRQTGSPVTGSEVA